MSTHRERILTALRRAGTLCDDCLAHSAAISPRQPVNIRCRKLASDQVLRRATALCPACRRAKIVNELADVEA